MLKIIAKFQSILSAFFQFVRRKELGNFFGKKEGAISRSLLKKISERQEYLSKETRGASTSYQSTSGK